MTPKIVKRNKDRLRASKLPSSAMVGMFRSGDRRKVKGGF